MEKNEGREKEVGEERGRGGKEEGIGEEGGSGEDQRGKNVSTRKIV